MKFFISTEREGTACAKKTTRNKKMIAGLFLAFFIFFAVGAPVKSVKAQLITAESASVPVTTQTIKQTIWQKLGKILKKAGSIAFQRTLSTALSKIAYDTATYIGSGGAGQSPLYVKQDLGDYLTQIGDEAAGTFVESFVNNMNNEGLIDCNQSLVKCQDACDRAYENNEGGIGAAITVQEECSKKCASESTNCASSNQSAYNPKAAPSFNVCQPSSLEVKLRIALGLTQYSRPQGPNCTASQMVANWSEDINKKLEDLNSPNFLDDISGIFDPTANDLGIYLLARTDLSEKAKIDTETSRTGFIAKGGWLDLRNIAGDSEGAPNQAQRDLETAQQLQAGQLGKVTGDILVDAANIFLNQLAITAFSNVMKNVANPSTAILAKRSGSEGSLIDPTADPGIIFGQGVVSEVASELLKPQFGSQADYNILSDLSICLDKDNPATNNCVIDTKFMQGISEKATVAEALNKGFLHGEWQITDDNRKDSYINNYSLRNISILRKYRILPVGWENAVNKIVAINKDRTAENAENPSGNQKPLIKATLKDLVSCFSDTDEYNDFSADFNKADCAGSAGSGSAESLRGFIDPNWVLKAPLNYCKKEGIGAQILNSSITPGAKGQSGVSDTLSELGIVRADDYCADEQTCIKERSDGSCEAYGYCNEEKRVWNFSTDSCDAVYNTCQSFTNANNGQSVAYLKNTLTYGDCDPESSGCRQYSLFGAYSVSTGTVDWSASPSLYLNKNLGTCSNQDEGCSEFLRVKPTWGGNLVMNSDLANGSNDWFFENIAQAGVVNAAQEPGGANGLAFKIETNGTSGGAVSDIDNSFLPAGFRPIPGQAYTVSADVYLVSGDNVVLSIGFPADGFSAATADKQVWRHLSAIHPSDEIYNSVFSVKANSASGAAVFYVKNLKFEMSNRDTGYSPYGSFKIYEKLLPPYLEAACYADAAGEVTDYSLKPDAPTACLDYARKCNQNEAGCDLFTALKDGFAVPAQVKNSDYCSAQCVGYDVYVSKTSYFNLAAKENLIPETATVCSAAASGCSEFTNLDAVAQGGEQREYYSSLKQCIKPSATECANFYSWEGTGNGYQLKAYVLKKQADGTPAVVAAEIDDSGQSLCNARIYNLSAGDPEYNPDCREFYNAAGTVSYHLLSRTVTCSDNCHAYRLSNNNPDNSCLNGGVWDETHQACVYYAIPGEGQKCQANENGCREYNGSNGNNVRLVSYADFENGLGAWSSNCANGISESSVANTRNGHSLQYNNSASNCAAVGESASAPVARRLIQRILAGDNIAAQLPVGYQVNENSSYSLKFLARATADTGVSFSFLNKDLGARAYFNAGAALTVKGGNEWHVYQINLDQLDHAVAVDELLVMTATGDLFIDDLILSEITDRYYLIKNSSRIPDVCYYDILNNYRGPDYNLGCASYLDRDGLTHNLHKFSSLCADSAIGCEQLIETRNYTPSGPGIWNDNNGDTDNDPTDNNGRCDAGESDCVQVGGDRAIYAIYDPSKQCNAADLGCSRLGQSQGGEVITAWSDVFKLNNPNRYEQILCPTANAGCEEWRNTDNNSLSYFKNPGNAVCIYRTSQETASTGKQWYKVPAKRCDLNGDQKIDGAEKGTKICLSDNDCGGGQICLIDNNDYVCPTSTLLTIGLGGNGNGIPTPIQDAALCSSVASGCTEYLDPASHFSPNLVTNPSFAATGESYIDNFCDEEEVGGQCVNEGWGTATTDKWNGASLAFNQQVIGLDPNKMYSLTATTVAGAPAAVVDGEITLEFIADVRSLSGNNTFSSPTQKLTLIVSRDQAIIFNALDNSLALLTGGHNQRNIVIKELIVDYQLQSKIDKTGCNGLANFDGGCILFNERSVNGASGLASLNSGWNAYKTDDGKAPQSCAAARSLTGSCNANSLVKVKPDRVCAKWLDCVTYGLDAEGNKTCYALGECDRLDDKNECANYIAAADTPQVYSFSPENDKNSTGYALLGQYYLGGMREVGVNTDAHFDFETGDLSLSCRNAVGSGTCPLADSLDELLVLEPFGAPAEYPAHGRGYIQVPAKYQISPLSQSGSIRVYAGQTYYLNYLINTKKAGLKAKVIVVDNTNNGNATIATFIDEAKSGWTRVVHQFRLVGSGEREINIYLTADDNTQDKYIYFDDINIEPVLQTGEGKYAVKDCRLYSEEDSLTCDSYNENVIKAGLYGYCLQYDAYNPGVCAMWYPIDKISSVSGSSQSALGYKGKFPLYYCTEADGNFQLVKKEVGFREHTGDGDPLQLLGCYGNGPHDEWCGTDSDLYKDSGCGASTDGKNAAKAACAMCNPGGYTVRNANYTPIFRYDTNQSLIQLWCTPNQNKLLVPTKKRNLADLGWSTGWYTGWDGTYYEGWVAYDSLREITCNNGGCAVFESSNSDEVINIGNNQIVSNETANFNPPIAVWYPGVNDEEDLKFVTGSDEEVYRVKCNRFAQLVNEAGENKAWVGRVGIDSIYPFTTPTFFNYGTGSNGTQIVSDYKSRLNITSGGTTIGYGRKREDLPFGAAVFPNGFRLSAQNDPVYLRNQYSNKNNEDILAGRPYGCSTSGTNPAAGCSYIGQCSADPNVFCLYSANPSADYNINVKSCASGGYGTCLPLWGGSQNNQPLYSSTLGQIKDSENILKTLFWDQYSRYNYVIGGYESDNSLLFDWTASIPDCLDTSTRNDPNTFCSVFPKVANVKLNNGLSLSGDAPYGGLYTLTFTTEVDKEQQPLKQIVVAWNAQDIQVITGEDNRSQTGQPHTLYHYYAKGENYNIQVKVFDNWGRYGCNSSGGALSCP